LVRWDEQPNISHHEDHEGHEKPKINSLKPRELHTTMVQNLHSPGKLLSNGKLGFGYSSRQDAKSAKFGIIIFLCGLCVFAGDIPRFGCDYFTVSP
jgi:hypothetical protein